MKRSREDNYPFRNENFNNSRQNENPYSRGNGQNRQHFQRFRDNNNNGFQRNPNFVNQNSQNSGNFNNDRRYNRNEYEPSYKRRKFMQDSNDRRYNSQGYRRNEDSRRNDYNNRSNYRDSRRFQSFDRNRSFNREYRPYRSSFRRDNERRFDGDNTDQHRNNYRTQGNSSRPPLPMEHIRHTEHLKDTQRRVEKPTEDRPVIQDDRKRIPKLEKKRTGQIKQMEELIFSLGDTGKLEKIKIHIKGLADVLGDEIKEKKEDVKDIIFEAVLQHPKKMRYYGNLVALLNPRYSQFVQFLLGEIRSKIIQYLKSGNLIYLKRMFKFELMLIQYKICQKKVVENVLVFLPALLKEEKINLLLKMNFIWIVLSCWKEIDSIINSSEVSKSSSLLGLGNLKMTSIAFSKIKEFLDSNKEKSPKNFAYFEYLVKVLESPQDVPSESQDLLFDPSEISKDEETKCHEIPKLKNRKKNEIFSIEDFEDCTNVVLFTSNFSIKEKEHSYKKYSMEEKVNEILFLFRNDIKKAVKNLITLLPKKEEQKTVMIDEGEEKEETKKETGEAEGNEVIDIIVEQLFNFIFMEPFPPLKSLFYQTVVVKLCSLEGQQNIDLKLRFTFSVLSHVLELLKHPISKYSFNFIHQFSEFFAILVDWKILKIVGQKKMQKHESSISKFRKNNDTIADVFRALIAKKEKESGNIFVRKVFQDLQALVSHSGISGNKYFPKKIKGKEDIAEISFKDLDVFPAKPTTIFKYEKKEDNEDDEESDSEDEENEQSLDKLILLLVERIKGNLKNKEECHFYVRSTFLEDETFKKIDKTTKNEILLQSIFYESHRSLDRLFSYLFTFRDTISENQNIFFSNVCDFWKNSPNQIQVVLSLSIIKGICSFKSYLKFIFTEENAKDIYQLLCHWEVIKSTLQNGIDRFYNCPARFDIKDKFAKRLKHAFKALLDYYVTNESKMDDSRKSFIFKIIEDFAAKYSKYLVCYIDTNNFRRHFKNHPRIIDLLQKSDNISLRTKIDKILFKFLHTEDKIKF